MTAIQTFYAGYRFRSRLEARWAVFLDQLRLDYTYEPEGFELPGGRYLPDFWVPYWGAWIEVKPLFDGPDAEARSVIQRWLQPLTQLSAQTDKAGVLVMGTPDPHAQDYAVGVVRGGRREGFGVFVACGFCGGPLVVGGTTTGGPMRCLLGPASQPGVRCAHDGPPLPGAGHVERALTQARRARFEFGETPTPDG